MIGNRVSGECMNRVYDALRLLDIATLKAMWIEADPYEPSGALLRHQINYTLMKKLTGAWK